MVDSVPATASHTVGPFFHLGLGALITTTLAGPEVPGERVTIEGRVLDGDGVPVSDALIEIWQADSRGVYAHPEDPRSVPGPRAFMGFGRTSTGDDGTFRFTTVKPGPIPGPGHTVQAPHLVALVFMRGLLKQLLTRLYFPNDPLNEADPILALVPPERRHTLIAQPLHGDTQVLRWDIILQGSDETVFFDY